MKILNIENKTGKIKLTDVVSQPVIEEMIKEIGKLFGASASANGADFGVIMNCAENAIDALDIEINSPGGSVFDGYTIYNEIKSLRERGVEVTATITGMAASMASVIAMACNIVRMVPHSRMMIHEASNTVRGNAEDLRKSADLLDGISSDIAKIYSDRTGKSIDSIRQMMKKETWMTATEAIENGFADVLFDIRAEKPKSSFMNILKVLFPNSEEEIGKVESALAELDSLKNDLSQSEAMIDQFKTEISNKDQVIADNLAVIAAKELAISDLTSQIENLNSEIESAKLSATQLLASIGQEEPIQTLETENLTVLEKLNSIKDPGERTRFYNKHREEILASKKI